MNLRLTSYQPTPEIIAKAVEQLKQGQLVVMPTETVYGLAANATSKDALASIFLAKGRPSDHPLILHIAKPLSGVAGEAQWVEQLAPWARDIPEAALRLAKAHWPGPLTLILPKAKSVLPELTGGQETVGIRCPDHPVAQALLSQLKGGVAAPSANRFGRVSPTTAQHVLDEFNQSEDVAIDADVMVLDGGSCSVGIESTIVDLTRLDHYGPLILRPGMITKEQIEQATGLKVGERPPDTIRHSGGLTAHYAPKTRLLIANDGNQDLLKQLLQSDWRIAWLAWEDPSLYSQQKPKHLSRQEFPKDPQQAAQTLYSLLRQLDLASFDYLIFPELPDTEVWAGVRDRLQRAAVGSGT